MFLLWLIFIVFVHLYFGRLTNAEMLQSLSLINGKQLNRLDAFVLIQPDLSTNLSM